MLFLKYYFYYYMLLILNYTINTTIILNQAIHQLNILVTRYIKEFL